MASRRLALRLVAALMTTAAFGQVAVYDSGTAAFGQVVVYRVDGDGERAVGAVSDFGTAYPGEAKVARFRARNVSPDAAVVSTLAVSGTGFTVTESPKLPVGLGPHEAFDFEVKFQATAAASYSAVLEAGGVSAILTAAVLPALTHSVGAAGLAFGTVEAGASVTRRVTVSNLTGWPMPVPAVALSGEAFAVVSAPARGAVLQPSDVTAVEIRFQPPGPGVWSGTLTLDDRAYPLSGSALGPAMPRPVLTVDLAEARSDRNGTATVTFDGPAKTAGAGTLTLALEPEVRRSVPFQFGVGDTGIPPVTFQTGTTAGTMTIAVELGGVVERKTIAIPGAPVSLSAAVATRTAAAIEVRLTGFDNTRTAGEVVYTFYDAAGNALPPIAVDNRAEFASYFGSSDAGGRFVLTAVFPVTGDASSIVEFAAQMSNSAGLAATGRVRF
jgi:hypothetical protein